MNRFQKLSSIVFLLLAFIYPPTLVEAKENTQNNVLNEQNIEANTNLVAGESNLLAHHHHKRHYYGRRRFRRHYYRRRYHHRPYYRHYYRRGRYHGHYRRGGWELVRDRHGRFIYDWRRH